jgi:hypothetical protein
MRLLYSNVIQQNKDWGAEWFTNNALNDIGIETETIDYRAHRFLLPFKFLFSKPADYFLLQRGDRFPFGILNNIQVPKFFWASELVSRRRDQDRLFKYGFDHVFVRGEICKQAVIEKGWVQSDKISILLSAFDPHIHNKKEVTKDIDVLFVGSLTKRRKEILDKIPRVTITKAYGKDMVDLFNRAKIVLNIHAEEYVDTETRVFEVLGSGAFLLTEPLGKENPFMHGKHIIESDIALFSQHIEYYLKHDTEREEIATQGYIEALEKHTYVHRAQQLKDIFNTYPSTPQSIKPILILSVPYIWFCESIALFTKLFHKLY